uniref:Uncharacterized protein n=1 Tax=Branchiostoma floridae TaxID=7739 RepID=C3ZW97_BRAFL|eukprot:XP_002587159.1 hypothetical protein BRAFLDRAFT_98845 [Branchiostoma floridae]
MAGAVGRRPTRARVHSTPVNFVASSPGVRFSESRDYGAKHPEEMAGTVTPASSQLLKGPHRRLPLGPWRLVWTSDEEATKVVCLTVVQLCWDTVRHVTILKHLSPAVRICPARQFSVGHVITVGVAGGRGQRISGKLGKPGRLERCDWPLSNGRT